MSRPLRTVKGEQHFEFFLATESRVDAILVKVGGPFRHQLGLFGRDGSKVLSPGVTGSEKWLHLPH